MLSSQAVAHPRFATHTHTSHPLHLDSDNDWLDTNCYTDLWIELLNGLGLDPHPVLAVTLGVDFEGDQWTFFKPSARDLEVLYGIDVIELAVYRALDRHCAVQLSRGNVPILEADAYYLPDVRGTYRGLHSKTAVAVVMVDPVARLAAYLHNSCMYTLREDDFDGLFRVGEQAPLEGVLPPYVEVARLAGAHRATPARLRRTAARLAAGYLARPTRDEAMSRFLAGFEDELSLIRESDSPAFDGYAFATLRQLGASCALAARLIRWLDLGLDDLSTDLDLVSAGAKRLILKGARVVATGRPLDGEATYTELLDAWRRIGQSTGRLEAVAGQTATGEEV
jgi:hypothetical protein